MVCARLLLCATDEVAFVVVAELFSHVHHVCVCSVAAVEEERLDIARELDGTVELHFLVRRDASRRHAAENTTRAAQQAKRTIRSV